MAWAYNALYYDPGLACYLSYPYPVPSPIHVPYIMPAPVSPPTKTHSEPSNHPVASSTKQLGYLSPFAPPTYPVIPPVIPPYIPDESKSKKAPTYQATLLTHRDNVITREVWAPSPAPEARPAPQPFYQYCVYKC